MHIATILCSVKCSAYPLVFISPMVHASIVPPFLIPPHLPQATVPASHHRYLSAVSMGTDLSYSRILLKKNTRTAVESINRCTIRMEPLDHLFALCLQCMTLEVNTNTAQSLCQWPGLVYTVTFTLAKISLDNHHHNGLYLSHTGGQI